MSRQKVISSNVPVAFLFDVALKDARLPSGRKSDQLRNLAKPTVGFAVSQVLCQMCRRDLKMLRKPRRVQECFFASLLERHLFRVRLRPQRCGTQLTQTGGAVTAAIHQSRRFQPCATKWTGVWVWHQAKEGFPLKAARVASGWRLFFPSLNLCQTSRAASWLWMTL